MGYRVINGKLYPIGNFPHSTRSEQISNKNSSSTFEEILKKEIDKSSNFIISNHAAKGLKIGI